MVGFPPQEILKQKSACARIIASKDSLIKEFQAELKAKDEECVLPVLAHQMPCSVLTCCSGRAPTRVWPYRYVKALKRQADDIEELLSRMDNQCVPLLCSCRGAGPLVRGCALPLPLPLTCSASARRRATAPTSQVQDAAEELPC